ncbi:MAG TPA: class I SAM-dependent methyltransferase, partial [Candidatus Acidoferrum sp.]|nr:class I SAM-dependent methyltransferase [Candidatus Acidoferrum sp.]
MAVQEQLKKAGLKLLRKIHNRLNAWTVRQPPLPVTGLPELNEVLERSRKRTPMADHLVRLFTEALALRPGLIVELGVGPAESTFVFERVARLTGCTWLSIDIEDRSKRCAYPGWNFVQADDVSFARDFPAWCGSKNIPPEIDLLFIDTSHYYEHSLREIESYFPFLSPRAKVFFHDTNLRSIYYRRSGRMELGWDNERGVIRAIEEYLGK